MVRKVLQWGVGLSLAAVVLIGVAHTRVGRPLLALMRGGCPALAGSASPERVEAYRVQEFGRLRGDHDAVSTPALAFTLGTAGRSEVAAWMSASSATCKSERGDSALRCTRVDAEVVPAGAPAGESTSIEDLFLQFDPSGRLVAVDVFRHGHTSDSAVAYLNDLEAYLTRTVGPPTKATDRKSAAEIAAHPFDRVELEYQYRNYVADISVMNFGRGGVRVREQYQWIPASG